MSRRVNYGFVIDTRRCIGCHACSTACKSENQVPLGVNRTWVKSTEVGRYPDVRRSFQVTRCNHCANPPCVRICPVTAMYQRSDGIVEFDKDVCIGCKACLQACPYDAIYVDPDTGTAAKCHYCGHKVDVGLEPACVVVCPTHAILAGDLDDPSSEIARAVAKNSVVVRKPEQGTAPKLFYIEGNAVSLHPTAFEREPAGMAFAEVVGLHGEAVRPAYTDESRHAMRLHVGGDDVPIRRSDSGTPIRTPDAQGDPRGGPIHVGEGRLAGQMAQVAWNAQHAIPWHWPVPAYLVTKGIGAGAFLALGGVALMRGALSHVAASVVSGLGLLALLATTLFLVIDLERPTRFLRIVFRPQAKSWLARGAFLLIGFSLVATAWFVLELAADLGVVPSAVTSAARMPLALVALPLAIGTAVYTAFLFAQCEGRDLWQSPLLPFHLLVQAGMMGGASLALVGPLVDLGSLALVVRPLFAGAILLDLFLLGVGEFTVPHASEVAAKAAHAITRGRYGKQFWGGAVVTGHLVPLALLAFGLPVLAALAGILAIGGLFAYEHAFVMAPQEIPNS